MTTDIAEDFKLAGRGHRTRVQEAKKRRGRGRNRVHDRGQLPRHARGSEAARGYGRPVIRRRNRSSAISVLSAEVGTPPEIPIRYTVRVEKTFEAVYENGVLRPLESLGLSNMQHVLVTISDSAAPEASAYFEPGEWSAASHDDISLEAVRRALSSIRGSLSDTVIASREERS